MGAFQPPRNCQHSAYDCYSDTRFAFCQSWSGGRRRYQGSSTRSNLQKRVLFLILLFSLLTSNYVCDCDGSAKCGAHDTTGVPQTPIFIHHYHPLLTCVSSVTSSYISVLHEQLSNISRIFRLQKVEKLGIPPLPLLQVRTHVELSRTHMQLSRTHVELSAAASLSM